MDTQNTPYSIKKPAGWDLIAEYTRNGAKPDAIIAEKAFNELLDNIKISNCDYFEDVCNAILTRIPAKIEAENYGFSGFNRSYFVLDTANKSKFYRKNEPVQIKLDSKDKEQFCSEQSIELQQSEWVVYNFESLYRKKHQLTIRASAVIAPASLTIWINNKKTVVNVIGKDLLEQAIGNYKLNKGDNKIKIQVKSGALKLDWFRFN